MINITDRPLILLKGFELHRAIQESIAGAIILNECQVHRRSTLEVKDFAFYRLFGTHNRVSGVRFDEAFIFSCFDANQLDSHNVDIKTPLQKLSAYLIETSVAAHGLPSLKRGIKFMLIDLWRRRVVLLPSTFTPGPNFPIKLLKHPLLDWLKSFDPSSQEKEAGVTDARRMCLYGPRLLWTTDWHKPKDISLIDLGELQRAARLYQNQKSHVVIAGGTQLPFTILAAQALQKFATEVQYTATDLARYSRWVMSGAYVETSFQDYQEPVKPAPGMREPRPRKEKTAPKLADPKATEGHDGLRRNFISLQKAHRKLADWTERDQLVYAGREHVDLTAVTSKWIEAMRAYMHQRAHVKGYRSDGEATAVLNLLVDYLFFYLPWWLELAKTPKVEIPKSPKELSRFAFISRHTSESLDEFPETLLTVIGWRRQSKETQSIAVHQLNLFFSFLETHFAEDDSIAGFNFRNPLNPDFDAPRIKTRNKTNKVVIPKGAHSYLVFYCYALEEACMQLEKLAFAGKLPATARTLLLSPWLKLSELGVTGVTVKYRASEIPIETIPNIFEWRERQLKKTVDQNQTTAFVPHCTVLRLLLTTVETGLRVQSVQWLDKRLWRRESAKVSSESYTFPLYVNTDKTREEPWIAYVVYRVRDLLKRQEKFQELFEDADKFGPVFYEGSPNTPFAPIEPLFRSTINGAPISDSTYAERWQRLMVGFEIFFRAATGEQHAEFYRLTATKTPNNEPIVRQQPDGTLYCPLSLLAIHTPHACRSTFVTNRKGILSLSETAQLIGHTEEVSTAHYDNPSVEDLQERLKESDIVQNRDFIQFEKDSEVHVRADKPDSALVRSFSKDRSATIKVFRFMPGIMLWSTEDSLGPDEGLQLLRDGPMSRIKFRETHVCPVGEECPSDIIERIGAPRRCGCCPLAMRCIDHAPAIAAKRNQLLERIRFVHGRFKALEAQGEPIAVLDELWDELELDANEYLGWQLSEELLASLPPPASDAEGPELLVEQPEVVKRHLMRISRTSNAASLMLQRIADSNAYPSMTTPSVQLAASQIKRRLLAGAGHDAIDWADDTSSAVADAARMLAVMMKATGLSREQTSRAITSPLRSPGGLLLAGVTDGH